MAEINGAPATPEELQTLALVNYGHFTSMRVDDHRARGISLHLERLVSDCREMFGTELDSDRVRHFVRNAAAEREGSFVVRVTIFDPNLQLGNPGAAAEPHVLVSIRDAGPWPPSPLRVQSATYVRDLVRIKHVGLLGQLWHRRAAQRNGFDDAVFVDEASVISEGATWNIGFFDGERVVWPDVPVLPGVTMRLLDDAHGSSATARVNLDDVGRMHAAFATNTTVGVRPITAIDNQKFPADHEIFTTLRKEYESIPAERI